MSRSARSSLSPDGMNPAPRSSASGTGSAQPPRRTVAKALTAGTTMGGGFKGDASSSVRTRQEVGVTLPMPVKDSENRNPGNLGLTLQEFAGFRSHAVSSGQTLVVRTGNPSRVDHVGAQKSRPKPEGLYNKTAKKGPNIGLVEGSGGDHLHALNEELPQLPTRAASASRQRVIDYEGNSFHGDIDMQGVYKHGKLVPKERFIPALNTHLDLVSGTTNVAGPSKYVHPADKRPALGITKASKIQHGAHDEWSERNADGMNRGIIPGQVAFTPDGRSQLLSQTTHYTDFAKADGLPSRYTSETLKFSARRDKAAGDLTVQSLSPGPRPTARVAPAARGGITTLPSIKKT